MQILITPEDIIKRCLWSEYKRFCLKGKTDDDIDQIIKKNKPEILSENDAFVIGLLRIVETPKLIHRFNIDIAELLNIKSTIHKINGEDKVLINKHSLLKEIIDFKDRFPAAYQPKDSYGKAINEVKQYVLKVYEDMSNLKTHQITIKEKLFTFLLSSDVKKILDKNK